MNMSSKSTFHKDVVYKGPCLWCSSTNYLPGDYPPTSVGREQKQELCLPSRLASKTFVVHYFSRFPLSVNCFLCLPFRLLYKQGVSWFILEPLTEGGRKDRLVNAANGEMKPTRNQPHQTQPNISKTRMASWSILSQKLSSFLRSSQTRM